MIGCFLMHGGQQMAVSVMKWLDIDVCVSADDLPTTAINQGEEYR